MTPESAAPARPPWHGVDPSTRLHVVTGKGGTGKTTVAAALALALAGSGRSVLLVEVEERQGISQVLDVAPLGREEREVAVGLDDGLVQGLSVEADTALVEYLQLFYRLGRAGGVLHRIGAIEFATTIAPGVRDVLLGGKVYEAVRRTRSGRHRDRPAAADPFVYDAVVLDAPPTGRVGRFLDVSEHLADLARMGPIKGQADSITRLLHSPLTAVHLVTLLEPMPVQETVDAVAGLGASGLRLGAVVVNQVRGSDAAEVLTGAGPPPPDRLGAHLERAGVRPAPGLVEGLVRTGEEAAARWRLEEGLRDQVTALDRPVLSLAHLAEGAGPDAVRTLAWHLREQGVAP